MGKKADTNCAFVSLQTDAKQCNHVIARDRICEWMDHCSESLYPKNPLCQYEEKVKSFCFDDVLSDRYNYL